MSRGIGLDFGTSNSALAFAERGRPSRLVRFGSAAGPTEAFRSILYCGREDARAPVEYVAGPRALERYLELADERRLMQSLKSFLASRLFTSTNLFGRPTTLQELIGRIARELRDEAEAQGHDLDAPLVVGRPVRFARSKEPEDDAFAETRLREALARAGFQDVRFEFEPVAAAYHYEQSLERDELVLIADFGGGTSDFCLLRVGPGERGRPERADAILGTAGVAIAGDAFDAKLVRHLVSPALGLGSEHQKLFGQPVPVPPWIYRDLERWHHLSFLSSPKTLRALHEIHRGALEPEKIEALIHLVRYDLGYELYRAIEATKRTLSSETTAHLRFEDPPASIDARVTRSEFEAWIAEETGEIAACVDGLFEDTKVPLGDVDRVFMTGGSSFVPAVRRIFEERFGADAIRTGGELVSVASGLALRALDAEAA